MRDPFDSAKFRLARADEQLNALADAGEAFFASEPYATVVEEQPETGERFYKFKFTKPAPTILTNLTIECIESLRATLDLTAFETARLSGNTRLKYTQFPIADDAAQLENVIPRGCKDLPPEIVTLFRGFKPYRGGNDAFWVLNKLCIANKHRFVAPVAMAPREMRLQSPAGGSKGDVRFPDPVWNFEKDELVYAILGPGAELHYKLNFTHSITFWDVEAVSGEPVGPVLAAIAGVVESVLLGTEAEARRIGLLS